MSKTGRALVRGVVSRSAAMVVTMLVGMALLPMIVHHLGDRLYGAWILVAMVLGYYGLLDLGLFSAVSRFVSRALGQNNPEESAGIITTSVFCFTLAGLLCVLITVGASLICHRFIEDPVEAVLFRNVILVLGISLAVTFPARCHLGILDAHLRYDLISLIEIVSTLVRAGLIILVLVSGGKLLALALVNGLVNLGRGGATILLAHKIQGPTRLDFKLVTRRRLRTLFGYSFYTFIAQVFDLLRIQAYPVIISVFLGLALVAPFSIAEQIRIAITRLAVAILSVFAPVFSRLEGGGDDEGIRRLYFFSYKISCYVGVFLVGITAVLGADFVERWMGAGYLYIVPILYVLLAGSLCAVIQISTMNFFYGTSRNRFFAFCNGLEGIINVVLSIILVRRYGLIGMAWGITAATVLVKLLVQPIWVCRVFKMSWWAYHWYHTLGNVMRPAVVIGCFYLAARYFSQADYPHLAILSLGGCVLLTPFLFFFGFTRQERSILRQGIFKSQARQKSIE